MNDWKANIQIATPEQIDAIVEKSKWKVTFTDKGQETLVECLISYDDADQLEEIIKMGFEEGFKTAMEGLDEVLVTLRKEVSTQNNS